jgi:type IV secretory pathway TraG/TraD family ATPase VirD4
MIIYAIYAVVTIAAIIFASVYIYTEFIKDYSSKTTLKRTNDMYDLKKLKNELVYADANEGMPLVFYGNHSKRKVEKSAYQLDLPSYRVSSEERGLIVGVSGTGKTNLILAQIFDYMQSGKSLVVVDVKPEIWAILEANNMFETSGYEPIIINPTDPYSQKYNFLDDVDFDDLDEMLSVIIADSNEDAAAFNEFARRLLKVIIYYLKDKNNAVSLTECYEFINSYSRTKTMFDDLKASKNEDIKATINQVLQAADNERFLSSGMNALTSALSMFNDKTISEMTRTSDFSLNEVLKQELKIVFLQFEQLSQDKTSSLFAMTVQHLIRLMMKNHHDRDDVFIILDELTNSSTIPCLPTQFNLMRAYKMPAFIYIQTVSSLYSMFGRERAQHLMNSCSLKIFYRTNDFETAKEFSNAAGEVEAQELHHNYNSEVRKNGSTFMKKSITAGALMQVPLIPPTEIMQLKDGKVVCICRGHAAVVDIPQMFKHTPITERATFNSPRDIFDTDDYRECYETDLMTLYTRFDDDYAA